MTSRLPDFEPHGAPGVDRRTFCRCAVLAGLALVTGCGCGRFSPRAPRLATAADLTEAEHRFGVGPARDGAVTYQPDVVIVEGGAAAVLAAGSDGLTWVLDAGARGAEEVRNGSVVLVTDRCAGRVLASGRVGDALAVVLGPVELTDVIRDCALELEQPAPLDQAVPYTAPGSPGSSLELAPVAPWRDLPLDAGGSAAAYPWPHPPAGGWARPASSQTSPLRIAVTPTVGRAGIGIRTAASNALVNVEFVAALRLSAPKVRVHLRIGAGRIEEASIGLSGAAGLRLGFIATSEGNYTANIHSQPRLVPVDLALPILLNVGSPLGLSLQQRFLVQSAFSARQSYLKAIGDYTLRGDLRTGYRRGRFQLLARPSIEAVNDSLIEGMSSISVGVSGMVLAHQVRLMAGIGGFGFRAGPYLGLTSSIGVSHGSSLATPVQPNVCRAATLTMTVAPGLGWQIPQFVADGINAILGLLRVRRIERSGGAHGTPTTFFNRTAYLPATDFCREAAGGGAGSGAGGDGDSPGGPAAPPPPPLPPLRRQPAPAPERPDRGSGGEPGLDLGLVCRNPELRRRLAEAGLDVQQLCRPFSPRP